MTPVSVLVDGRARDWLKMGIQTDAQIMTHMKTDSDPYPALPFEAGDCFTTVLPVSFMGLDEKGFRLTLDFDAGENFVVVSQDDGAFIRPCVAMLHTSGQKVWGWPHHFCTLYMMPMI